MSSSRSRGAGVTSVVKNRAGAKTKILSGSDLAGFVKERQAHDVRALRSEGVVPRLLILRDSDNPVITKYVNLKIQYGEDIGVEVIDRKVASATEAKAAILEANSDPEIHGMIVQLPLKTTDRAGTDEILNLIAPEKDVDGLNPAGKSQFDSATATAINWLLAGHNVDLAHKKIAIVGRGRLVGGPLIKIWTASGYDLGVFGRDGDLAELRNYDVIVTATGEPHLIVPEMLKPGVAIIDAGTASEDGKLVGDVDDAVRSDPKVAAITPQVGGVGPLTVSVLFENVIAATKNKN